MDKELTPDILDQAIQERLAGKPVEEIYNAFPEYQNELKEAFAQLDLFNIGKEDLKPNPLLLTKILSALPSPDTLPQPSRPEDQDLGIFRKIGRFISLKAKILVPLGVAFAFLVIVLSRPINEQVQQAKVTSNIEQVSENVVQDSMSEQATVLQEGENDIQLITAESQAAKDFGQIDYEY